MRKRILFLLVAAVLVVSLSLGGCASKKSRTMSDLDRIQVQIGQVEAAENAAKLEASEAAKAKEELSAKEKVLKRKEAARLKQIQQNLEARIKELEE